MGTLRGFPNPRPLRATLPPRSRFALGLARSGGAARVAAAGREGQGVEVEVPQYRRSRWAKPGSAYANPAWRQGKFTGAAGASPFPICRLGLF